MFPTDLLNAIDLPCYLGLLLISLHSEFFTLTITFSQLSLTPLLYHSLYSFLSIPLLYQYPPRVAALHLL